MFKEGGRIIEALIYHDVDTWLDENSYFISKEIIESCNNGNACGDIRILTDGLKVICNVCNCKDSYRDILVQLQEDVEWMLFDSGCFCSLSIENGTLKWKEKI